MYKLYSYIWLCSALLIIISLVGSSTVIAENKSQSFSTDRNLSNQSAEQLQEIDLVRVPIPIDFDDQTIDWDNVFFGFEGAHADVIENPYQDDDNDSGFVGRMVKDAEIYWAGAFFWTE